MWRCISDDYLVSVKSIMVILVLIHSYLFSLSFSFNATPPTEIYTLSLHDALPICIDFGKANQVLETPIRPAGMPPQPDYPSRSEEHTSELQSRFDLVCRLLLEKKN